MKKLMKKSAWLLICAAVLSSTAANVFGAEVTYEPNLVVYFYSTTCATCGKASEYVDDLARADKDNFEGLGLAGCSDCAEVLEFIESRNEFTGYNIKKVNIGEAEGKALLSTYALFYNVGAKDEDVIPAVFTGDVYAVGLEDVKAALSALLTSNAPVFTPVLIADENIELRKFNALTILPVFLAGLANGLNPCGLSMLLLFLTALMNGGKSFIAAGFVYCAARFVSYFALGTLFYGALARFNLSAVGKIGVAVVMFIMLALAVANIADLIRIRRKEYSKIRVQLPKKLKDFNQTLIKRLINNNAKMIFALAFVLGVIISLGEFLCTGQIYLGTIVTVLNAYKSAAPSALLMFSVYNAAMAVVPVTALLVVGKTYSVFNAANFLQERLPVIKLINAAVYIAFIAALFVTNFR